MCSELQYESEVNLWLLVYPCGCSHTAVEERGSACGYVWMHLCVFVNKRVHGLFTHKVTSSFLSFCCGFNWQDHQYKWHLQLSYFFFFFVIASRLSLYKILLKVDKIYTHVNLVFLQHRFAPKILMTHPTQHTYLCPIKCSVEWESPTPYHYLPLISNSK